MKQQESKWCPECEQCVLHIKGWCLGCDIEEEVWHDSTVEEVIATISESGVQWKDKNWIVAVLGTGPVCGVDTKKEGVGHIEKSTRKESISMSRVVPGLYQYVRQISGEDYRESKVYYVGKPDVYHEQEELSHLLNEND